MWDLLSVSLLQRVGINLAPGPRQVLRAVNRHSALAGGAIRRCNLRLHDLMVLSPPEDEITCTCLPRVLRGAAQDELNNAPTPLLKYAQVRRCRSLLRGLGRDVERCAFSWVAAQLQSLEVELDKGSFSLPGFAKALRDCLSHALASVPPTSAEGLAIIRLLQEAEAWLLTLEVPELLYAAVPWPPPEVRTCSGEALVLSVEMELAFSKQLAQHLSGRWAWAEVGVLDQDGLDVVPRMSCNLRSCGSHSTLARRCIRHCGVDGARLLLALDHYLLTDVSADHKLALWLRADWPVLFKSSIEVRSAAVELVFNERDEWKNT